MSERIEGIIPPMVTPFDDAEELDLKALADEVDYLVGAGVHGLAVGGSTGEGAGLDPAELYQACRAAVEAARGRVPVYGSAIPDTTREAIRLGLAAKEAGVGGLQVTPPHYLWRPDAQGLVEYYGRLAEAVGLPIIVYNVLPWAPITADTMEKLAAVPLVRSVKQSGGDLHTLADLLLRLGHRLTVLSAVDDLLYPSFALGAHGAIAAVVTVAPGLGVSLFEAVRAGRHQEALEVHRRLLIIWRAVEGPNLPAKVKWALELQGRRAGRPRSPLRPPNEAENEAIRQALVAAGVISGSGDGPRAAEAPARLVFYVDGASSGNPGPAGIGVVAFADGRRVGKRLPPEGLFWKTVTNNTGQPSFA